MLKDFNKLETFLSVVKEKSFSKASKKLGISQPAVTQQIRFIEDYLETKIIERKKSGIKLTKAGEQLYGIAQKLDHSINNAERDIFKIINREMVFLISASNTIGNYILPNYLNDIKEKINNNVSIDIKRSEDTIEDLLDRSTDIALTQKQIFKEGVIYREWFDDELVLFSNQPLPEIVKKDELIDFYWICREDGSATKGLIKDSFEKLDIDCDNFHIKSIVSSSTMVLRTILKSSKEQKPTVSIISRHVIADDIESGRLFESRIFDNKIKRKLYIAYLKERRHDAFVDNVVNYLLSLNSSNELLN